MTTYAFPDIEPSRSQIQLLSNTTRFVSPFTGFVQTLDRGGERWLMTLSFQNLTGDDRAVITAFGTRLNGSQHRFTLKNHGANNRGAFGGTPLVAGADQLGASINIDGATSSVTNWIRAGDFFAVNGELKQCVSDADSDGSGNVTIEFRPRLRSAPADNAAITTADATGTFLLADNAFQWTNSGGPISNLTLQALEDVPA